MHDRAINSVAFSLLSIEKPIIFNVFIDFRYNYIAADNAI